MELMKVSPLLLEEKLLLPGCWSTASAALEITQTRKVETSPRIATPTETPISFPRFDSEDASRPDMIRLMSLPVLVNALLVVLVSGTVEVYKGESRDSFDCNVDLKEPFSCICLSPGLWKIYSSCLEFSFVGVKNKYCFSPREMIRRVERSSTNNAKLSVTGSSRTRTSDLIDESSPVFLQNDDVVIIRHQVTISDGKTSICLADTPRTGTEEYCLFGVNDLLSSITSVTDGCREGDKKIYSNECYPVMDDVTACLHEFQPRNGLDDLKRPRRMLPPLAVNKTPFANPSDPDDEDFWDPAAPNPYGADVPASENEGKTTVSPIIVSEIWHYLDQQLDEVLGLGNPGAPPASMQEIPVFKILAGSKDVMLKTCPTHYVRPEFLDLAVDTFTAVLLKRNYLREFNNDYTGMNRILQALIKCKENATSFPFIDESMHEECEEGSHKANPGAYEVFGNKSELVVHEKMESWEFDPIIDTVWKIVVNAYQQCFGWFDTTYNDVFRYTTILESLFQGEIHDIWLAGKTQGRMLGGFLGNMKEITEFVTLCTTSTGLETAFPWTLSRPEKTVKAGEKRIRRHVDTFASQSAGAAVCYGDKKCVDL